VLVVSAAEVADLSTISVTRSLPYTRRAEFAGVDFSTKALRWEHAALTMWTAGRTRWT